MAVGDFLFQGDRIATGPDGRVVIAVDDGTVFSLAGDSSAELARFDFDSDEALHSARIKVTQGSFGFVAGETATRGGFSIDTPFAVVRSLARGGALGTLTAAALVIALVRELEAAGNEPLLLDDAITYKDLQHGTLLIAPKGGATRGVVLDDPELTIVVGPPESGFLVQQLVNSPADMLALLAASEQVNFLYALGQADPFTTGSTDRAETHLFFPGQPDIRLASAPLNLLPPLGDDPNDQQTNFTSGGDNAPPPTGATLVLAANSLVLSQDETPGEGTADPFPIALAGIAGIDGIADLGRTEDGNPFVSTAGSVFTGTLVINVEASAEGVDSGLDVTGGGSIFLYTETTADGDQVVVGREGGPDGDIAFIIYITEDGQSLWVQQTLPIDHGDDNNDHDSVLTIIDAALLVRATVTDGGTVLTQTLMVGDQVAFKDDGPVAMDDFALVQAETAAETVNALIILDKSGSMGSDSSPTSRISLAKAAILDFAAQPNVLSIRILPFDDPADAPSVWFDLTQPGALDDLAEFLDDISGGGLTNYQDAINDAQQTWTAPPNAADLTNVYFISDGAPTTDLESSDIDAWEDFLEDNSIDNAYAIGIGTSVNDTDLQDVAYPNDPDETNNVIIIDSADDLSATLQGTVMSATVSGNVLDNDDFGTDGPGFIKALRYDSDGDGDVDAEDTVIDYDDALVDPDTNEVTFDTFFGGTFTFNFETGDWEYTTPDDVGAGFVEHFAYTIVDGDNDETTAALNVTVQPPSDQIALYLEGPENNNVV